MPHTENAARRLAVRNIRRGALILATSLVAMIAAVVASYSDAGLGRAGLSGLADNPAIRALTGLPYDLSTAGGFTMWKAGLFVAVLAGLWALLASTRVLRGDEEPGRLDLLLSAPIGRGRLLVVNLGALSVACLVQAVAAAATLVAAGQELDGSALFGAGTGLVALLFVTLGAVTSQLFSQRRKAAGTAGVALGAAFVVRMVADASESAGWLRWFSPLGWFEELRPFGGNRILPLLPLAATSLVLGALSLRLTLRRDVGEGIIRDRDSAPLHPFLLRNPLRFSWRQGRGALVAWGGALVAFGLVVGGLTEAVTNFLASSPAARQAVNQVGFGGLLSVPGFVATMYGYLALTLAFYAVSAIHVVCEDEEEGRLDAVLASRITRSSWLGAHVLVASVVVIIAAVDAAAATWLGVLLGSATLSFSDALVGALNVLPLVALPLGVAVLVYGFRPTLAVPVTGGGVIVAYLAGVLGPILHLPGWVLDLSPFHHVSLAPAAPVQWPATLVMLGIALAAGLTGMVAFSRRDLL